jgi:MSHA pilin protein MshD
MKRWMKRACGFTLIELLIFIVIVSVGLLGVLAAFGPAVRGSADPMIRKQTLNLAESLLREIMHKAYENDPGDPDNNDASLGCTPNTNPACSPNSQTARPNYNDVDDYIGFSQGIVTLAGATVPGLASCTQTVNGVTPGTLNGAAGKFISVTATCGGESITLTAFRGNYGG